MRRCLARLGIAAFIVSLAFGQSPDRVLPFTQPDKAYAYQEISNAIRAVANVQGTLDAAQRTFSISGAPDNVAAAAWLFGELDASAGAPGTHQQYAIPGANDGYVRIYRLANIKSPMELQEMVNATRSVAEINRMFPVASQNAILLRATQDQAAAAEFLIENLDQPSGAFSDPPPFFWRPAANRSNQPVEVVRVFRLKYAQTGGQIQEIVNAVRSLTEVNRMFPFTPIAAVAARDAEGKMAAAEWLIRQLDQPVPRAGEPVSGAPAVSAYRVPQVGWPGGQPGDQDAVRVFRLSKSDTPEAVQSIVNAVRTSTRCQRIFPSSWQKAIAMRGTEAQAAEAERLISELELPSIPKPQ